MKKIVNIGMSNRQCYFFMGRMHSNAFSKVGRFFDLDHEICPKVICARDGSKGREFAERWSWQDTETDWRQAAGQKRH